MLKVTDRAAAKVKQLMTAEGKEGYGLRVAVLGGGCSGFQYGMSYEKEKKGDDHVLEFEDLRVFVDARSGQVAADGIGQDVDAPKALYRGRDHCLHCCSVHRVNAGGKQVVC